MSEIKYEIKLNDNGRPYIDLPVDLKLLTEDKFFGLELARYILRTAHGRMTIPPFDQLTIDEIADASDAIGQVSDEVARILWHQMKTLGDATFEMGQKFHVICDSIEERDKIDDKGILYYDKLYVRQEGLKVLVREDKSQIYELRAGISNENWEAVL